MKTNKLLTLLTALFLFANSAKADGNAYFIVGFTMETESGQIIKGYVDDIWEDLLLEDSLSNSDYLKRVLATPWWIDESDERNIDTLIYSKDIIRYPMNFQEYDEDENPFYHQLSDMYKIPLVSIKKIKIDTLIYIHSGSYLSGILNRLKLSDTVWMKKEHIKEVESWSSGYGYGCEFKIFVHEESQYIEDILRKIEAYQKEYNEIEENTEISEDIKENQHYQLSKKLDNLLEKLNGRKVVIVYYCTD